MNDTDLANLINIILIQVGSLEFPSRVAYVLIKII